MVDGDQKLTLDSLFAQELGQIALRRDWLKLSGRITGTVPVISKHEIKAITGPIHHEVKIAAVGQADMELTGLALSGGGIRSAAFCLGVIQALNQSGVFDRFDYMSTVSGGGYIGSAVSATSYATRGGFAFDHCQGKPVAGATKREYDDTEVVRHIRNYSNFLAPRGLPDWITSAALLVRGLVTNAFVIAPYLLVCAALTLAYNPTAESLGKFGPAALQGLAGFNLNSFSFAAGLAGMLGMFFLAWSVIRSTRRGGMSSEFKGALAGIGGYGLIALLGLLFLGLQNELLALFTAQAKIAQNKPDEGYFLNTFKSVLVASPFVVFVISNFRDQLVKAAKDEATALLGRLAKYGSTIALLLGAMIMPFLLWLIYLRFTVWGLACGTNGKGCLPWFEQIVSDKWGLPVEYVPAAILLCIAAALFAVTWWVSSNAYSLHRLYRDRLAKAFVIHPAERDENIPGDLRMLYNLKISDLIRTPMGGKGTSFVHGPFPLMNTALNVQGSATVNRRGRNADFFWFSPLHVGSPATGFVPVSKMEKQDPHIDLAAIMAISGAAASSNMGANTIRPLTLTLALLNVRLGYWLPNPRKIIEKLPIRRKSAFLWREMISGLTESLDTVLLTDGGHIENLGVYELLRRRCKLIVAVDAEADPGLEFSSFITLQRYARIDLGIRIELPWQTIAENTRKIMAANVDEGEQPTPVKGPHAALGIIHYDDGETGYLLYFKSSLTGDENDNVRDYGRRNPSFPHETTADQFFSEEQFEAYRALGFHVSFDALKGRADIVMPDGKLQRINGPFGKKGATSTTPIENVASILGL